MAWFCIYTEVKQNKEKADENIRRHVVSAEMEQSRPNLVRSDAFCCCDGRKDARAAAGEAATGPREAIIVPIAIIGAVAFNRKYL